jgi:hypothetical protein
MMKLFLSFLCIGLLLASCKSNKSNTGEIYFIPFKDAPFSISNIDSGTQVKLIAFSDGQESSKDATYYPQFIGVTSTGDTVRVLSPLITVGPDNTFTSPFMFDHTKGIDVATVQPKDSSVDMLINVYAHTSDIEKNSKQGTDLTKVLRQRSNAQEMIVMVKGVAYFENMNYKTAIGILHFDEQPW